jgi:hypothetical protein
MADVAYIVEQLNGPPFNMKLMSHKFSDLKGLNLLQKVKGTRRIGDHGRYGDVWSHEASLFRCTMFSCTSSRTQLQWTSVVKQTQQAS